MRILTVLALAAVAAGIYQYRQRPKPFQASGDSDELLAERVRLSIGGAASSPVEVSAANGIVTLRGRLRSRSERDLVEAAALAVPGVSQVTNFLETQDQPQVAST
jgi:osmotically-inducible protein OsmY